MTLTLRRKYRLGPAVLPKAKQQTLVQQTFEAMTNVMMADPLGRSLGDETQSLVGLGLVMASRTFRPGRLVNRETGRLYTAADVGSPAVARLFFDYAKQPIRTAIAREVEKRARCRPMDPRQLERLLDSRTTL